MIYNYRYNPVLWGVPKGSYASNPEGSSRISEFRQMVQVLYIVVNFYFPHLSHVRETYINIESRNARRDIFCLF